jgi:hypothetical protein
MNSYKNILKLRYKVVMYIGSRLPVPVEEHNAAAEALPDRRWYDWKGKTKDQ